MDTTAIGTTTISVISTRTDGNRFRTADDDAAVTGAGRAKVNLEAARNIN
ncbi:MAG: hypothetical protein H7144_18370 [Burkholderiales bacterium]|nr:hypothetical protein [Phycisphaerae bacterium]